jgi:cytidylate kinase
MVGKSKIYNSIFVPFSMDIDHSSMIVSPVLVTLSGSPGSGKSTVAEKLCEKLRAQRIYVGQMRRDMAARKGMTIEAFNQYAVDHPETDIDVDTRVASHARELYRAGNSVIVEGRTQFHFLPESIKLYIFTDPQEAARRILGDLRSGNGIKRNENSASTLEEQIKKINDREANDAERYQRFYGIDHRIPTNYDVVIDSTSLSREQVLNNVLQFLYGHQQSHASQVA